MDSLIVKSKVCIVGQGKVPGCGEEKLLEEFYRQKDGKHGRLSKCKVCLAVWHRQHYKDNKEKIIERQIEKTKYLIENDLLPKSKVCAGECGEEKLLGEFHKNKSGKYGRTSQCKLCFNQQVKIKRFNRKKR